MDVSARQVLTTYWKFSRRHTGSAFLFLSGFSLAVGADAAQPWFLKVLFDLLETTPIQTATIQVFVPIISIIVGVKLFSWVCWRVAAYFNNRFQPRVMAELCQEGFENLMQHSYQFFADNFAGSLVRKVFRFGSGFERLADEVCFRILPIIIVLITVIIGLWLRFPLLAIIFIVWTIIFILSNYIAAKRAIKRDLERAEADSDMSGILSDAVTNAVTVKLFSAQTKEENLLREANTRFARAQTRSWDLHEIIFGIQGLLMVVLEILLLWIAITFWIKGVLTLGDIAFIQTSLILVFDKLWEVSRLFRHFSDGIADGKEMVEILLTPHEVRDHTDAKPLMVSGGEIAIDDVTFAFHENRDVLDHFSLIIRPDEKVALVGPSGAGKSTITKLLFRFYNVNAGEIRIDGQNIADVTQESLREAIALVPQEPILFHRTLLENIRYGKPKATKDEVVEAAKKAHCHEFIVGLPQGYDTYVGERGVKLSGGERQRVAIARAILKNAPILVLDEATSSLDSESEALIQEALRELMKGKTVVVIAHRLSTIMMMDRIVVMEEGKIVSTGTHAELMRKRGTYKRLWNIQAGAFTK